MTPQLHYDIAPLPDGRPCITVTGRGANVYDADALLVAARPYFTIRQPFVIDLTGIGSVKNEYLAFFIGTVAAELRGQPDPIGYLKLSVVVRHRPHHHVQYGLEHLIDLEEVPEPSA